MKILYRIYNCEIELNEKEGDKKFGIVISSHGSQEGQMGREYLDVSYCKSFSSVVECWG